MYKISQISANIHYLYTCCMLHYSKITQLADLDLVGVQYLY